MKPTKSKDHFAILGVEPAATPEEIRKAYLDRAREIHPDRFDFITQPAEWRRANDELALLNEAYAALRSAEAPAGDVEGEEPPAGSPWPAGLDGAAGDRPADDPFGFDLGELTAGEAGYGELPKRVRDRLKARQAGLAADQLRIKYRPYAASCAAIALTLSWLAFLLIRSAGAEWDWTSLAGYAVGTAAAGLLLGRSLAGLVKWFRASLKPALYLTPLYVIQTDFDRVSFAPVWTVDGLSEAGRRRLFPPWGVRATVRFPSHAAVLRFPSRKVFEEFESRLKASEKAFRHHVDAGRFGVIRDQDDFHGVRRRSGRAPRAGHRWLELSLMGLSLLISLLVLTVAVDLNMQIVQDRLVRYPGTTAAPQEPSASARPLLPTGGGSSLNDLPSFSQPTGSPEPNLGAIPTEGALSSLSPSRSGQGPAPPAQGSGVTSFHDPRAMPLPPGTSLEEEQEAAGMRFKTLTPMPFPSNGHVTRHHEGKDAVAPLKITLRDGEDPSLVTLEEWTTRRPVLSVFIQSGRTVELKVPLGSYRLTHASGKRWYGNDQLFGREGLYGVSDQRLDFAVSDNQVTGHAVELGFQPGTGKQ
jgi:hypothetical protein